MPKPIEFEFPFTSGAFERIWNIKITPGNPTTICEIRDDLAPLYEDRRKWDFEAYGTGVCKHGDRYDLETGCRMALRSALRKIENKGVRAAAWKRYLEIFPSDKRVKPNPETPSSVLAKAIIRLVVSEHCRTLNA